MKFLKSLFGKSKDKKTTIKEEINARLESECGFLCLSLVEDGDIRIQCGWEDNDNLQHAQMYGDMLGYLTSGLMTGAILEVILEVGKNGNVEEKRFVQDILARYETTIEALAKHAAEHLGQHSKSSHKEQSGSPVVSPSKVFSR